MRKTITRPRATFDWGTDDGYCPYVQIHEAEPTGPEPSPVLNQYGQPMQWYIDVPNRIGYRLPCWDDDT